jgi:hypothetical protein
MPEEKPWKKDEHVAAGVELTLTDARSFIAMTDTDGWRLFKRIVEGNKGMIAETALGDPNSTPDMRAQAVGAFGMVRTILGIEDSIREQLAQHLEDNPTPH